MHLHALLVHGGDACIEVDIARARRAGGQVADLELRPFAFDLAPFDTLGGAVLREQVEPGLRIPVRMDIDRLVVGVGVPGCRLGHVSQGRIASESCGT